MNILKAVYTGNVIYDAGIGAFILTVSVGVGILLDTTDLKKTWLRKILNYIEIPIIIVGGLYGLIATIYNIVRFVR